MVSLKNIKFEKEEIISFAITAFVLSFIISFKNWGTDTFDLGYGLGNLLLTLIVVIISLYAKLALQKYTAHKVGFDATFKRWTLGLVIGLVFAFLSNGNIIFAALGGLSFVVVSHMRIGHKYGLNHSTMAWISVLGPLTFIGIAAVYKLLFGITTFEIFMTAMKINLIFAFYSILPIPMLGRDKGANDSEGLIILYRSTIGYIGTLALVLLSIAALLYLPLILGLFLAAILSMAVVVIYYVFFDLELFK